MYADREEAQANRSIRERLDGDSAADSSRRRPIAGKRQREGDQKWEHDLFEKSGPQSSNRRVGTDDLRLKLQRKNIDQPTRVMRGSVSGGGRDLREKLSGTPYSRPIESQVRPLRPKPAPEASKPLRDIVMGEEPDRQTKKIASTVTRKKTQQKVETVDSFLQSLGLEKYSITFQAEEVDMAALVHMADEDLKALGVPMGPRKKILLALESKV
ncbi:hypothetical protein ABFS83_14G054800 [Erythranthe nasuta]